MKRIKQKTKLVKKQALMCLALALAIVIASGTNVALAEWREPESPPMSEQLSAPLTTGSENQAKKGYLLIDPVGSDPTKETSLTFTHIKPLHVTGDGALFSIPYVYSDKLTVDTDTLYVDSLNEWVGIGTTEFTSGTKFKVSGGTVQVGTEEVSIAGRAVSGYSSDDVGIYGGAGVNGVAGVYGLRMADSGWAVKGVVDGTSIDQVGVMGESADGYGIYATSSAADQAAVYARNYSSGWAGYFDGRLGAGSDMVGNRFLPTNLQTSLIPFTSRQEVGSYSIGTWTNYPDTVQLAFDGTYVWAVTNDRDDANHNFFKVRVSDGVVAGAFTVGTSNHHAVAFDGTYIWIVPTSSEEVFRFDPRDGSYVVLDSSSGFSTTFPKQSLAVSSINGISYVWTSDPLENIGGEIIKINSSTLSFETFDFNGITGLTDPAELAFDGIYLWVIAQDGIQKKIVRLLAADPANSPTVIDTVAEGCNPYNIYADGEYVWCLQDTDGKLLRIWAEDPDNTRHPNESFGPLVGADDRDMVFDGTYLWVVDFTNSELYRYLAADPSQYSQFSLTFQPKHIVFDGTYLWITQADGGSNPILHKYYSGTGLGHTDLNSVVNLDPASQQTGSINVAGSAEVGTDTTVGTDLDVYGNLWGGSDETVSVSGDEAVCQTDGYFIKGITLDNDSKISEIVCRGL
jgi:hypothetical protein